MASDNYLPNSETFIRISHLEAYKNYFQSQINNLNNKLLNIERDNDILLKEYKKLKTEINNISLWDFIKRKIRKQNIC